MILSTYTNAQSGSDLEKSGITVPNIKTLSPVTIAIIVGSTAVIGYVGYKKIKKIRKRKR